MAQLSQRDIITYFTGVRTPTFEEDFIIEMGRKTGNIRTVPVSSPQGLPLPRPVALDIEKMAVDYLSTLKTGGKERKLRSHPPWPARPAGNER